MADKIDKEKGIALIISLGFIALFTAAIVIFVSAVLYGLNLTKHQSYSTRAFYLAESGIQKALYELRKTYSWSGEGPSIIYWQDAVDDYSGGAYEVTVTTEGVEKYVVSRGYYPGRFNALAKRSIEARIKSPTPSWFFNYAIAAAGDVKLTGNSAVIGDIAYGGDIDPSDLPNSQKLPDINPLPLLDFGQLRSIALNQIKPDGQSNLYTQADIDAGKPFPTSFWFDPPDNTIPNVVYVETSLIVKPKTGAIGGFFVVAGNVLTDPDAEADATINGQGTIDGCVYTLGDFTINGLGQGLGVHGGVWAKHDAKLNGNAIITYNQDYMDAIRDLGISYKPQIVYWKEIHI